METLFVFFFASVLLALTPGPDNLFVLALSLNHGRRAGLLVVAGLCSGLLVHTAIVALGLTSLLLAFPPAITLIKTLGAMYLLYLAWRYWQTTGPAPDKKVPKQAGAGSLYIRGIIMNVSNPKVAIFFLAYLPQFIDSDSPMPHADIILLGLLFIVATVLVFGAIALFAGSYNGRLGGNARRRLWLDRATGMVLGLLALNLFSDWF